MRNHKCIGKVLNVKGIIILALFCGLVDVAAAVDYYVDKDSLGGPANDVNPGTKDKPWQTLVRAFGTNTPKPTAGDTVYIRDGVYKETVVIMRGGAPGKPLTIKAYAGEEPVIDAEEKRANGITLPGGEADYARAVIKPGTGSADYVVIDGIKVANATNGNAIAVTGRKGIVLQNMEAVNSRIGVLFNNCMECKLLKSNIHHCDHPVYIQAPCSEIVIADNHVHHSGRDGIDLYGPGDGVIFSLRGNLSSIEEAGPGIARFTVSDEKIMLNQEISFTGHLRGSGDVEAGLVKRPDCLGLFYSAVDICSDNDETNMLAGGSMRLMDERNWFVLHNNPEWDNKPYSPDGKQGMFEIGQAKPEDLAKAKYFYIARTCEPVIRNNRDIQILRNHVHNAGRQGILVPSAEYVLIQGNRVHDSGATGIQIETGSRHLWIDGNEIHANNRVYSGEFCLCLDENIDAVVQNNVLHESQKGLEVTQCARILVRKNTIYNNRAQCCTKVIDDARCASSGLVIHGGSHNDVGAPVGLEQSAFVHNTFFGNGTSGRKYNFGGICLCPKGRPKIGRNVFLNNIIRNEIRDIVMFLGKTLPLSMDGNIYYAPGNVADIIYQSPDGKENIYSLAKPEGFEKYRRETGCDAHSQFGDVAFMDAKGADFHLAKGSMAIDRGVPLTVTIAEGKGAQLPVANVWCFSAGFRNSKGEVLIEGDDIMVGKTRARITGIDWDKQLLTLDRTIEWEKDAPVSYVYTGSAPDAGAFEFEPEGIFQRLLKRIKNK